MNKKNVATLLVLLLFNGLAFGQISPQVDKAKFASSFKIGSVWGSRCFIESNRYDRSLGGAADLHCLSSNIEIVDTDFFECAGGNFLVVIHSRGRRLVVDGLFLDVFSTSDASQGARFEWRCFAPA